MTTFFLVKADADGSEEWCKTFGGSKDDYGRYVQETCDRGFIIVGFTESFGAGSADAYLIKTDADGNEDWSKTFGGSEDDGGESVRQTSEGGFIIGGTTYSMGSGSSDAWLVKTDTVGNKQWDQTFGGSGYDYGKAVQVLNDCCYIMAGSTSSFGAGQYDAYLVHYCADVCECDMDTDGDCDMADYFLFGQDWGRTDCP